MCSIERQAFSKLTCSRRLCPREVSDNSCPGKVFTYTIRCFTLSFSQSVCRRRCQDFVVAVGGNNPTTTSGTQPDHCSAGAGSTREAACRVGAEPVGALGEVLRMPAASASPYGLSVRLRRRYVDGVERGVGWDDLRYGMRNSWRFFRRGQCHAFSSPNLGSALLRVA